MQSPFTTPHENRLSHEMGMLDFPIGVREEHLGLAVSYFFLAGKLLLLFQLGVKGVDVLSIHKYWGDDVQWQ